MLSYILWDINPEIFGIKPFSVFSFQIGGISIRWYGLLFALGFLVGQRIMAHIFKKEGLKESLLDSLLITMLLSTVIGARFGHFLFYEPQVLLSDPLQVITPPFAGLASHGAAIGILLGLLIFSKSQKMSYLWVVDRIVIVTALSGCFIRLGNLMNSEIVGKVTDVSWGFIFKRLTEYGVYSQLPRHPAQLYEAFACLVLCIVLYKIWDKYKTETPQGLLLGVFLIWVFGLRFIWEFFKENQVGFENELPINMGQILSIPAVLLGIYFIAVAMKNKNKTQRIFTDELAGEKHRV